MSCSTRSPSKVSPPSTARTSSAVMAPEWSASKRLNAARSKSSCRGKQAESMAARKSEYRTSASWSESKAWKMRVASPSGKYLRRAHLSSREESVPCLSWSMARKCCRTRARSALERLQATISRQQRRNRDAWQNCCNAPTTARSTRTRQRCRASQGCAKACSAVSRSWGQTCKRARVKCWAWPETRSHCVPCMVYLPSKMRCRCALGEPPNGIRPTSKM
mmetsp:Transcript_40180/g.93381  ORF Transcript_40180/g.93381 Transcript_40180/m.93381 type:complete len:220 (-) Transcript_40180:237-896(-)